MKKGMLEVYLQSATGLKNKDFFSKMDPYAILTYRGQYFQSIVAKKQGSTPIWNQKFLFMAEEGDGQMFIKLYDKDRFTGDDFIGSVKVPLDRVFSEFMCPLETYDVILPSGKVKGAVQLALTFTPKEAEES